MPVADSLSDTLRGIIKVLMLSRRSTIKPLVRDQRLIIMANGPSLADTIAEQGETLSSGITMAVNFAANTPSFDTIKPQFYILADPLFFTKADNNFKELWHNIAHTDRDMTLLVPASQLSRARQRLGALGGSHITLASFNAVGVEGFRSFRNMLYRHGLAMPRPRNVLIPAIMCGIRLGFKEIYLVGADHSWLQSLSVDDDNRLVAIQHHFYEENSREQSRITTEYTGYKLHQILESLTIAFRSYHLIEDFAEAGGIKIYNATPHSYIDAFARKAL